MEYQWYVQLIGAKNGIIPNYFENEAHEGDEGHEGDKGVCSIITKGISDSCVYKWGKEFEPYLEPYWVDVWVVCYREQKDFDIDKILYGTGYSKLEDISGITIPLGENSDLVKNINKPIGFIPFCDFKISKEMTKKFLDDPYNCLNGDLYSQLLKQDIVFDDSIFELEKNEWFLASYIINTVIISGYLTEEQIRYLRNNIESNTIYLPELVTNIITISNSIDISWEYVSTLAGNIID